MNSNWRLYLLTADYFWRRYHEEINYLRVKYSENHTIPIDTKWRVQMKQKKTFNANIWNILPAEWLPTSEEILMFLKWKQFSKSNKCFWHARFKNYRLSLSINLFHVQFYTWRAFRLNPYVMIPNSYRTLLQNIISSFPAVFDDENTEVAIIKVLI